jgi:hypothetical protein
MKNEHGSTAEKQPGAGGAQRHQGKKREWKRPSITELGVCRETATHLASNTDAAVQATS